MLGNHPNVLGGNAASTGGVVPGSAEWGLITGTLSDQTDLQTALDEKAPLASPTFTGTPAAPTATLGTSDTQIATTAFVQEAIAEGGGGSDPSPTGNRLLSGGGVAADGGLDIVVEAANYVIQGVGYSSAQTPLTAAAADPTNPRIDVVAVDSNGDAVIITGTPAATPLKPDVDPVTQLELTFILVEAAATDITVNIVDVYRENVEYTMTESGTSINLASTNNPRSGSTDIEGTAVPAGDYFQAEAPGTLNLADYDSLIFFIRSKASWPNAKQLTITARNSGAVVGQSVVVKNGTFGFDSSITGSYQLITIPTSFFAANGQAVNQIRWACAGGGSTIGFYVDDISLQGGIAAVTDTSRMQWRGAHNSTVLYNINDTVSYEDTQYVSIQSGQGQTPSGTSTYWQRSGGSGIRHFMWSFNPKAICDLTIDRLFLLTVGPDFPNGLKIIRWNCSFDADPTTEADLDFKRADAFIGVANSAVVDVCDTTNGVSSETNPANINGGNAVALGKVLYLEFGTAYTTDNLQIIFEMWGYAV